MEYTLFVTMERHWSQIQMYVCYQNLWHNLPGFFFFFLLLIYILK